MQPIHVQDVQSALKQFAGQELYLHLETTNGAYAAHRDESFFSVGAYIRNGLIEFQHGKISGNGPYRVGLKTKTGWIYAEGLTDWVLDDQGRLLMAGHDPEGKLGIALQLSRQPF